MILKSCFNKTYGFCVLNELSLAISPLKIFSCGRSSWRISSYCLVLISSPVCRPNCSQMENQNFSFQVMKSSSMLSMEINVSQSVSQCEWENGRGRKKVATLTFRRRRQGQAQRLVQRPVEPVSHQDNSPLCCSARTSCFQDQTPVGKETQCKVNMRNELRKKANI